MNNQISYAPKALSLIDGAFFMGFTRSPLIVSRLSQILEE